MCLVLLRVQRRSQFCQAVDAVEKPVSSFVAEAFRHPPEVAGIPCVSLTETAAETLVSLTRRTAMERAGLSRDPDTTLVRHIHDLHAMRDHIDREEFVRLVPLIAAADAAEFRNQYPAYAVDIKGETRSAVTALQTDDLYRKRYNDFMSAMVFGDRPDFRLSIGTVVRLERNMFRLTLSRQPKSRSSLCFRGRFTFEADAQARQPQTIAL